MNEINNLPALQEPEEPHSKLLIKSKSNIVLTGTASGLADYFGIEPVIVRLLFAAGILLGGYGILIYFIFGIILSNPENIKFHTSNIIGGSMVMIAIYYFFELLGLTQFIFFIEMTSPFLILFLLIGAVFLIRNWEMFPVPDQNSKPFEIIVNSRSILGVSTGLAEYFNVKVSAVRLAVLFLSFSTFGIFAIIYLLIYLFAPKNK